MPWDPEIKPASDEQIAQWKGPFVFTVRRSTKPSAPSQKSTDKETAQGSGQPKDLSPTLRDTAIRLGLDLSDPTVLDLWTQLAGKDEKTPDERLFLKELEFAMTPEQRNSLLW